MQMGDVITFKPKTEIEAFQQVEGYIEFTKTLTEAFNNEKGESISWREFNWSEWLKGLNFAKHGINVRSKGFNSVTDVLDSSILDFAKAYALHQQTINRTQNVDEVVVLRVVEKALLDLKFKANVCLVDEVTLDLAAEILQKDFTGGRAYRIGGKLQSFASFVSANKLTKRSLNWENPIGRPRDSKGHVSLKKEHKKNMPSLKALDALAEIWSSKPTDVRDIYVTSNSVILLSQPSRVGELNSLSVDPIVYKTTSSGVEEMFLNWYGQKGFGYSDKPVPKTFAPFCEMSIARIKGVTEGPRNLARFLEEHPDEFPTHEFCPAIGQDVPLSPDEACRALCLDTGTSSRSIWKSWLKRFSKNKAFTSRALTFINEAIIGLDEAPTRHVMTLKMLNVITRERYLPKTFPFTDQSKKIKFKDALNCYFLGQFGATGVVGGHGLLRPYALAVVSNSTLNDSLSIPKSEIGKARAKTLNIFKKWGYEGDEYTLRTHQFRHYLNTLASKGGVGEIERARWSGRLDISQNATYNHITTEERVEQARELGLGRSRNLATVSQNKEPILLADLDMDEDRIAHYTLYGVCVHDFAMEPCQKYRDCIACKKHKCIKGDEEKLKRIKKIRDDLKLSLEQARKGIEKEFYGADKWLTYTMDRYEKAINLVEILEDENIEDGAVIPP